MIQIQRLQHYSIWSLCWPLCQSISSILLASYFIAWMHLVASHLTGLLCQPPVGVLWYSTVTSAFSLSGHKHSFYSWALADINISSHLPAEVRVIFTEQHPTDSCLKTFKHGGCLQTQESTQQPLELLCGGVHDLCIRICKCICRYLSPKAVLAWMEENGCCSC